ncbi:MAG: CsbD family protein [Euzebya sp.]
MPNEADFDDAKGRVKEAAGSLSGDQDLKNEGKKDQAAAKVKDAVEGAKDKANDLVDKVRGKD